MPTLTKCKILELLARHCVAVVANMGPDEVIGSTIECSHRDGRIVVLERTVSGWRLQIGSAPGQQISTVEELDRALQDV